MGKIKYLIVIIFASIAFTGIVATDSYAADARSFNAGRIIDDVIFTNSDSMTVQDIQNFLNSKVSCDTWGSKRSELGGGTRAQWMNARGIYAPFRCTTDYRENPATGQNNYGKNEAPAGSISAAEIIYNYSRQFRINPQVILATLQKENGMITDEWPTPKQFSEAMGFGCPDNVAPGAPACNPQYGSFSAQVYQAARHFRGYIDNGPGWWIPFNTGWNSIAWSPNASCGRGNVYIENRATVALYSYTPYQPNQAAKNAQYGTGDGCSAYGNRNFYLYFTDWFGATYADVAITSSLQVEGATAGRIYTNTPVKVSFAIHNYRGTAINIGGMAVTVRSASGANYDYALRTMVIPPYTTVKYEESQVFSVEGVYTFGITNYSDNTWKSDYPATRFAGHVRTVSTQSQHMPSLSEGITIESGNLHAQSSATVRFKVRNNSASTIDAGRIGLAVRGPQGQNLDPGSSQTTLQPGQERVYIYTVNTPVAGIYSFDVAATTDSGTTWEPAYPAVAGNIKRTLTVVAKESATVVSGVDIATQNLYVGSGNTVSIKVKNFSMVQQSLGKLGFWGRDPQGRNVDPGIIDVTLAPGEERVIDFPVHFNQKGKYTFGILGTKDNGRTWNSGPELETDAVRTEKTLSVTDPVVVDKGIELNKTPVRVDGGGSLRYTIKNHSQASISLGKLGFWGRDPQGRNVDPGIIDVTLAPGEERVIDFPVHFNQKGKYTFGILGTKDNGRTWNSGPDRASNAVQTESIVDVKSQATITSGATSGVETVSTGAVRSLRYTIKNHSQASISLGKLGFWGRDPQGRNVDPGIIDVTLAPGEERVIDFPVHFNQKGKYTFGILGTKDNGRTWNSGPELETDAVRTEYSFLVN